MIRENTIVVSVRMDARDLAVLIRWWRKQMGDQPMSTSGLVKESLGVLVDMGIKQWPELAVESQQEAYDEIEQSRLNVRSTRSRRAMGRGLQREQATFGAGSERYDQPIGGSINNTILEVNKKYNGMLQQGMGQDELEAWRSGELARIKQAEDDTKTRQQETITTWSDNEQASKREQTTSEEKTEEQRIELGIRLHAELWFKQLLKDKTKQPTLEWLNNQMISNFDKPPISVPLNEQEREGTLAMIVSMAEQMYANADVAKLKADNQAQADEMMAQKEAKQETKSLDASKPDFMEQYKKREQDKLNKLKAGLGGDPRQA
jgi:hypothetical protein